MSKQLSNNYHKSIAQGKKSIIKQIMKAPNFGIVPVLMKVALMFVTHCRRPDPSTPAGLQQQPVLLWRFHPWASANGETNFPPLLCLHVKCENNPRQKRKTELYLFLFFRSLWKRNTQICPIKLSVSWRWDLSAHILKKMRCKNQKWYN